MVGVPSASAAGGTPSHRAGYHLFDFDMTEQGISVSARQIAFGEQGVNESPLDLDTRYSG